MPYTTAERTQKTIIPTTCIHFTHCWCLPEESRAANTTHKRGQGAERPKRSCRGRLQQRDAARNQSSGPRRVQRLLRRAFAIREEVERDFCFRGASTWALVSSPRCPPRLLFFHVWNRPGRKVLIVCFSPTASHPTPTHWIHSEGRPPPDHRGRMRCGWGGSAVQGADVWDRAGATSSPRPGSGRPA